MILVDGECFVLNGWIVYRLVKFKLGGDFMDLGISGMTAFVMGGSKGIGRAISLELASAGCKVAVVARNQDAIEETVEELRASGAVAEGFSIDMSVVDNFDTAVNRVADVLGWPDIAIFNPPTPGLEADTAGGGTFLDGTEAGYEKGFQQLVSCFGRLARLVIPAMKERQWGRIVTIGSCATKQPQRHISSPYAVANTTRLAAVSLSKTISWEVAPFGITVNTIATGPFNTDAAIHFFGDRAEEAGVSLDDYMANLVAQVPVGRIGKVEEIASLAAYLCSQRAAFTTGENILCDGGMSITPV
jgi:3-oxoacyl-[acyl-carrier protein] reductase